MRLHCLLPMARQDFHPKTPWAFWLLPLFWTATVATPAASGQSYGDITFFLGSDLHYGDKNSTTNCADSCRAMIDLMNALPGQSYPAAAGGGTVDTPRGVLLIGDLTSTGAAVDWSSFTNDWGLTGERRLNFPVYECFGNHDCNRIPVPSGIKARNPFRTGLSNISSNGCHYSWDWDFLHLVCLNVFPGQIPDSYGFDPQASLAFLVDDLAQNVGDSHRPVVIYHHFGLDSFSAPAWSDQQRSDYSQAISNYNVIAIFAGHNHFVDYIPWCGFNTFNDGTLGKPLWGLTYVNFLVAHVTKTNLTVAECRAGGVWGAVFNRPIITSDEPCIVSDPHSTTAPVGSTASLTVSATGPNLNYQWLFNGADPIAGATNSTLCLPNLRLSQSGTYQVLVTNTLGSAVSQPATLDVSALLTVTPIAGLLLSGSPGDSVDLEFTDLLGPAADWQPLASVTLTDTTQLFPDTSFPVPPQRFYRSLSPLASLDLKQVLAVTVSGDVGDSLQLEYSDAPDPDPNWLPLAHLTLTNTSQLCIDPSAPGPGRRYRAIAGP